PGTRNISGRANGELILASALLTAQHPLHSSTVTILVDARGVVGRLDTVCLEIIVDVAADVAVPGVAVVEIAADQRMVRHKVASLGGHEREPVLVLVRKGVRLADVVEE